MSGARFVRFYPSDWRSGCIGLTPEEQGFYLMVCAHFWETGARLPTDDAESASRLMLDVRMYRRIRDKLIRKGKLHASESGYFNPRAELELERANRANGQAEEKADVDSPRRVPDREHQNGRDQAPGRVGGEDTVRAISETLRADIPEKSRRSLGEVSENFSKKDSEINGPLKSLTKNLTEGDNNSVCLTTAARKNGQTDDPNFVKCKRELNGTTTRILAAVRNSLGVYGTQTLAAEWLADCLDDHGAAAVLDAFQFLERCQANGQTIRDAKSFIAKNARVAAENTKAKTVAVTEAKKQAAIKAFMTRY